MRKRLIYYETMAVQWVSEGLNCFFRDIGLVFLAIQSKRLKKR